MWRSVLIGLLLFTWAHVGAAQGFTKVTFDAGVIYSHSGSLFGNGVSFVDFTGDGLDDITLAGNNEDPIFYRNTGSGQFSTLSYDVPSMGADVKSIQWVDFDNDGDKDLCLLRAFVGIGLYERIEDGTLVDVSEEAGLTDYATRFYGASWGDYDNDGWLDLYVANFYNPAITEGFEFENHLYHNNQDGTFTEVTVEVGVSNGVQPSFQGTWLDYDEDGDQDLFIINDRDYASNALYQNQGDGTFIDVSAESGWENYSDSMCFAAGDYDNDTDIDVFLADTPDHHNDLYKFDSLTKTFQDIGESAGLHWDTISWGSLWIDYDCDMIQDLYVMGEGSIATLEVLNNFYRNNGDDTFTSIREEVGLGEDIAASYVVAMGDINNDGYPDFMQNNVNPSICHLWANSGGTNNYLKVKVEGTASNRQGLGTWIRCHAGGVVQTRYTFCGENYISQDSDYEFFGLDTVDVIDSLVVTFLSGHQDVLYDLPVNQHLTVVEGSTMTAQVLHDGDPVLCEGQSLMLEAEGFEEILWSNGAIDALLEVTEAGGYSYLATNEHGVSVFSDTVWVELAAPLEFSTDFTHVQCNGDNDGQIDLNADPDLIASVTWSHGATGSLLNNLPAGDYSFVMEDLHGCVYTGEINITEPPAFVSELQEVIPVACLGDSSGAVVVNVEGGIGLLHVESELDLEASWNPDSTEVTISGYGPGLQIFSIGDESGCYTSGGFVMTEPELPLEAGASSTDASCFGYSDGTGSVENITGGVPPYTINWGDADPENLAAGMHMVEITDSLNCTILLDVLVGEPEELNASLDVTGITDAAAGWAELTVSGGTPPYAITWSTGDTDILELEMLELGEYEVEVTDAQGCTSTVEFVITSVGEQPHDGFAIFPNPVSDQLTISSVQSVERFELYDALGRRVLLVQEPFHQLQLDLSHLPAGTYQASAHLSGAVVRHRIVKSAG